MLLSHVSHVTEHLILDQWFSFSTYGLKKLKVAEVCEGAEVVKSIVKTLPGH